MDEQLRIREDNNYRVFDRPYEAGPFPDKRAPEDFIGQTQIKIGNLTPGYPMGRLITYGGPDYPKYTDILD